MKSLFFLFVPLLFLLSSPAFSQEAEVEREDFKVHEIKGEKYYIHLVDSGNTLYAISRMYAIPVDVIKRENPRLTETLTIGDRLLIPLKEIKRKDLKKSPNIDGNFLIYEVQRKNTLYSISKEYHVEINDIIAVNPQIEEGLKKGMKIKIPIDKIRGNDTTQTDIIPAEASPFVTHEVMPKETLYSLSKRYKTSIDSIKLVNNGLAGGLKVGDLINIPQLKQFKDTTTTSVVAFDSAAVKPFYSVALLLPFYLDAFEDAADTTYYRSEELSREIHSKAQYAIEFYQGFKIAADSLVSQGLHLKLKVMDTQNDSAKTAEILKDTNLAKVDLIIGPLYYKNFRMVADFAKMHEINIVSPVKLSNKILLGNRFVSKVSTSNPVINRFMGTYIYDSLRFDQLLFAYPDHVEERKRVEVIKKEYYQLADKSQDTNQVNALNKVILEEDLNDIQSRLDTGKWNTIIVPSNDQAFVTQLLTKLDMIDDYKIKVLGLSAWENFENIDVDYLNRLNVELIVSEFIDYKNEEVDHFQDQFYRENQTLPEEFAYLGFDVGYYYLSLMKEFGTNFEIMFLGYQEELLGRKFEFFKTGIESGYENHSTYVIRYHDCIKKRVY
mgnify:CR=1 FL=1